jgi:dihydrofolate synthase/folylpolyglutamate synthase
VTRAEALLAHREVFGIRLGLERMRALLARLGDPQRGRRAIHVVGTNGKSSTVRFCAAMLGAQGLAVGAYLSPHVTTLAERVQAPGAQDDDEALAAAVERVDAVAGALEAELGEPVTQFEALTAAAFLVLAERGAEAWVVEAGLGGRYDATNVLGAEVVALTGVALDHVAQLGSTRRAIAAEKLAVVRAGATLVVGDEDAELAAIVRELAPPAGRIVHLAPGADVADAPPLAARGRFQRANLAVALAACEAFAGDDFDREAALAAAAGVSQPGRLEVVDADPLVVLDGAHNPHGAAALAAELPEVVGARRPRVGVIGIFADKDVDGILDALAPALDRVVATAAPSARALPAAALAALLRERGLDADAVEPPAAALAAARELAGTAGAVVVGGSLGLLAELAAARTGGPAR